MEKKYQIFISSPFRDLEEEREEIIRLCLKMKHIPAGMEMFNAPDQSQMDLIKARIDLCDYYCVIVARRYGSRPSPTGKSYTEMEFDYAVSKGIPAIRCLLHDSVAWLPERCDTKPEDVADLNLFRQRLSMDRMATFWRTKDDLGKGFMLSLIETIELCRRPGWIRAENKADESNLTEMARLSSENERLRQALDELKSATNATAEQERLFRELENQTFDMSAKLASGNQTSRPLGGERILGLDERPKRTNYTIRTFRISMPKLTFLQMIAVEASVGATLNDIRSAVTTGLSPMLDKNNFIKDLAGLYDAVKGLAVLGLLRTEQQTTFDTMERPFVQPFFYLTDLGQNLNSFLRAKGYEKFPVLSRAS